jgi:hypothetical protein
MGWGAWWRTSSGGCMSAEQELQLSLGLGLGWCECEAVACLGGDWGCPAGSRGRCCWLAGSRSYQG